MSKILVSQELLRAALRASSWRHQAPPDSKLRDALDLLTMRLDELAEEEGEIKPSLMPQRKRPYPEGTRYGLFRRDSLK